MVCVPMHTFIMCRQDVAVFLLEMQNLAVELNCEPEHTSTDFVERVKVP